MNALLGPVSSLEYRFTSFTGSVGEVITTIVERSDIVVSSASGQLLRLRLDSDAGERASVIDSAPNQAADAVLAACEALFSRNPCPARLELDLGGRADLAQTLIQRGMGMENGAGGVLVLPEMVWQLPEPWLPNPALPPYPQFFRMSNGRRHPGRPPKPTGTLYSRHIPWLGETLSFRVASIEEDLERLNRWMNDPRVAVIWDEAGDLEKHRAYLSGLLADPHMIPLIGCFDGVPFAYFEIYWAKENRLGPFYDADDYDRGWHVLVGEDAYRGRARVAAWLPSLMHYLFLADCRTQRIVGEPRSDHHQQIRNLEKSGFAQIKHFDFPHKRAVLVSLLRERFFNDRLWAPNLGATPQEH